jgi:hypothetical protein
LHWTSDEHEARSKGVRLAPWHPVASDNDKAAIGTATSNRQIMYGLLQRNN